MSEQVEVPFGEKPDEQATLLLAAAESLGLDANAVGVAGGAFVAPQEVVDKAFEHEKKKDSDEKKEPAKKATAKKTAKKATKK